MQGLDVKMYNLRCYQYHEPFEPSCIFKSWFLIEGIWKAEQLKIINNAYFRSRNGNLFIKKIDLVRGEFLRYCYSVCIQ